MFKFVFGILALIFGIVFLTIGFGNLAGFDIGPPMPEGSGRSVPIIGMGFAFLAVGSKWVVLDNLNTGSKR